MSQIQTLSRGEAVQTILEDFNLRAADVLMAMVATKDGLSVASSIKEGFAHEEDELAVAASRISDMTTDINTHLKQGETGRILIEGTDRTTIVTSAGNDVLFIVVIPTGSKIGITMQSISRAVNLITELF